MKLFPILVILLSHSKIGIYYDFIYKYVLIIEKREQKVHSIIYIYIPILSLILTSMLNLVL